MSQQTSNDNRKALDHTRQWVAAFDKGWGGAILFASARVSDAARELSHTKSQLQKVNREKKRSQEELKQACTKLNRLIKFASDKN